MEENEMTPVETNNENQLIERAVSALQERFDKRAEELRAREDAIMQAETRDKAVSALRAHGLPEELADAVTFADADAAERGVAVLDQAFRAAVQKQVEERLSGEAPRSAAPEENNYDLTDEMYYASVLKI